MYPTLWRTVDIERKWFLYREYWCMELWCDDVRVNREEVNLWKIQTKNSQWIIKSIKTILRPIRLCLVYKPIHIIKIPKDNKKDVNNRLFKTSSILINREIYWVWIVSKILPFIWQPKPISNSRSNYRK